WRAAAFPAPGAFLQAGTLLNLEADPIPTATRCGACMRVDGRDFRFQSPEKSIVDKQIMEMYNIVYKEETHRERLKSTERDGPTGDQARRGHGSGGVLSHSNQFPGRLLHRRGS